MIKIADYSKTYNGKDYVVVGLNLSVEKGDIFGFIGHNGAGKTTTIKSVVGILEFEKGDIFIDGVSIKSNPIACKKIMSYVPDNPEIYENLTGLQYIYLVCDLFGVKKEERLPLIEKYCKESGFVHNGKWHKWASYGFDSDGVLVLDEYYPNATEDTYKGVSGYIYSAENVCVNEESLNINNAVTSSFPVPVSDVEFIEDAYAELIDAEKVGLIKIRRYEEMSDKMLRWIEKTIRDEYKNAENEADYRHFLKAKFSFLNDNKFNGE